MDLNISFGFGSNEEIPTLSKCLILVLWRRNLVGFSLVGSIFTVNYGSGSSFGRILEITNIQMSDFKAIKNCLLERQRTKF